MQIGSFYRSTGIAALALLASCATSAGRASACSVDSLDTAALDPMRYAGEVLCGEVFAMADGRTVRLVASGENIPPSLDLAWLVTTETRQKLEGLSETPQRYYIEARIDPMRECFQSSESGESCSPFRRPVFMHLLRAQKK
jgi:hypothetical protein